jgi:uncharacterized NAD(P)/FAD-binding protein YdhS
MQRIAVIGAGLSGTLLIINLLKRNNQHKVHVRWIDREDENHLGPAYSTDEDYLLNVPAEKMGAFAEDPGHFLKWVWSKNITAKEGDYLPRKLYRRYILEILEEAKKPNGNIILKRILGEATDIKTGDGKATVFVKGYGDFQTDKIVLALGNPPPKHPVTDDLAYLKDKRYVQVPWKADVFDNLSEGDNVVFVGTGQTMVDLAVGLFRKNHKGRLTAISRHGILPMSQKKCQPYPSFYNELERLSTISAVTRVIRKHIRIAEGNGLDPRAVIDSLRPDTISIWKNFPVEERKRFLRHLFRYWEIIRSRIPPRSEEIINELRSSGRLKIIAGRITGIKPSGNSLRVNYNELHTAGEKTEEAELVINCMGPCSDYEQVDQELIKNLLSRKIIKCDPVRLGINATPDGSVIMEDGTSSEIIYGIGPVLRGILWETIAAPEIRVQAEKLVKKLVSC